DAGAQGHRSPDTGGLRAPDAYANLLAQARVDLRVGSEPGHPERSREEERSLVAAVVPQPEPEAAAGALPHHHGQFALLRRSTRHGLETIAHTLEQPRRVQAIHAMVKSTRRHPALVAHAEH